jgi:carbamoyltransferase
MIVCGLKLTHDGAVALVDGTRLVFSVEMEKLGNARRYSQVEDLTVVPEVLAGFGYRVEDVDAWVIDGWDGRSTGLAELTDHGEPLALVTAPYREGEAVTEILDPGYRGQFRIGGLTRPYTSYVHVAGHIASAYCSSPFARRGESSVVLVWDGGLFPRLYLAKHNGAVAAGGEVFPLIGHAYAMAAHHFGPYRRDEESLTVDDLGVAGKLMAYIALGKPQPAALDALAELFPEHFDGPGAAGYRRAIGGFGSHAEPSHRYVHAFYRDLRTRCEAAGISDVDVLASVHEFLEELLVRRVAEQVRAWCGPEPVNLCFVGGCALNIKWNSALRAHPQFREVWVPPFPNDSGSAIGAACAQLATAGGLKALDWHHRCGPALTESPALPPEWTTQPCTPAELAAVLHRTGEPVVVLDGRAEVGPRALGGRSILAVATNPAMKDLLNQVKKREDYRPVAPICLTEHAPEIFRPGTPDPYMLFDHAVRPAWADRIPAIVHLDGTARLQTVCADDDPVLTEILRAYHRLSGIPVLCNTSANLNGRGFFPDVASAVSWDRIPRVWSAGMLYVKAGGSR